ncbi:TPA: hypothetical protein HA241_03340 [Candidatus Woesearchaeota archaeon]|nr:hypothetical protein [Candidatus Woesearchaeota archaeon]
MDIRKTKTCERCKAVVPLERVRLYPKDENRNLVLCDNCCEEVKKRALPSNQKNMSAKTAKVSLSSTSEYSHYNCTRCNYNFRADKNKAGVTHNLCCPYCGKSDRLEKR